MYWSERQKQLYKAMEKDEEKLKKKLSSFYDKEYAKLDKTIAAFYEKFGTDNVIEYRTLMESLPEADKMLLIEQFDEFAKKYPQYAHLLPVRNNIYKLNRLEGLQYSVRMSQLNIGAVNNEEITKYLEKQAERGINAAAEAMGFGKNFNALNGNIASKFVGVNWSNGKNFSERIWENTDKLSQYLNNDIATGFARGVNYRKLTDIIQKRYSKVTRNDAYRLIYTEGTYVMAESSMAPFEDDFEQYRVSTVGDSRVCPICRDLSGQVFNIKDRQPGVNFPPLHPWCRCTFTIEVEDWDAWMDEYERKHGGNIQQAEDIKTDIKEPKPKDTPPTYQNIKNATGEYYDTIDKTIKNAPEMNMKKMYEKHQDKWDFQKDDYRSFYDTVNQKVHLSWDDVIGNSYRNDFDTFFHETGHAIDSCQMNGVGFYSDHYKNGIFAQTLRKEAQGHIDATYADMQKKFEIALNDHERWVEVGFVNDITYKMLEDAIKQGDYASWDALIADPAINSLLFDGKKPTIEMAKKRLANEINGLPITEASDIQDMFDAQFGETLTKSKHGQKYWENGGNEIRAAEAFAEMWSATLNNPGSLDLIKEYFPESYEIFLEMVRSME